MEKSNLIKLFSNYGTRLWSMVSVFVFIPLYIEILGAENYGLISFYALLLGVIGFADSGMTSAVIKELSQETDISYKYSVFKNLENIYLLVCVFISGVIFFLAPVIADYWLSSSKILREDLIYYIRIIDFGVTTQLIGTLYFGTLFALNNQVKSNVIQFGISFSKSALIVVVLLLIDKSIELYFIWQIVCNVCYILILRYYIIKTMKYQQSHLEKQFNTLPNHIKTYITGMIGIAIISALNIQADKLITSKMFDLSTFGYYNIASSLSQLPIIIATPLIMFVFPLFSKYQDREDLLKYVFNKIYFLICIVSALASVHLFLYSKEILLLWTKGNIPVHLIDLISFDAKVLVLGSFFLSLQFPLYYILLSKNKTKYTIYQGIVQIVIGIPLLYFTSKQFGLLGVPYTWLFINFFAFVYLFIVVSKKYLDFGNSFFYKDVFFIPIFTSIIIACSLFYVYKNTEISFVLFAVISAILVFFISLIWSNFINKRPLFYFKSIYNFPNE